MDIEPTTIAPRQALWNPKMDSDGANEWKIAWYGTFMGNDSKVIQVQTHLLKVVVAWELKSQTVNNQFSQHGTTYIVAQGCGPMHSTF